MEDRLTALERRMDLFEERQAKASAGATASGRQVTASSSLQRAGLIMQRRRGAYETEPA
ncbi:hypothetical protein [Nonomuraea basaltis]|uniref:hypothetical protein n=1 Tax=Nonomuraea basaltis TaxID=2495887 RepID=UPI001485DB19|nr:hypothetical protein [Nonomuraea basaltis]